MTESPITEDWQLPTVELRLAIHALTAEHAWRLDHGQSDTLHHLYTVSGELMGLPPRDLIGRAAIAAWGAERVKLARISRHVETNQRLVWKGDALHGVLYACVYRADTADTSDTSPFMVGDYEDEYAKENGVWKIRRRTIRRAFRAAR